MAMTMNNDSVEALLDECGSELTALEAFVTGLGMASNIVPYLSKYGLVKACGTIEQAFKAVVADKCSFRAKAQLKNYLTEKVRNSSSNPSFDNICKLLKSFDPAWKTSFKSAINAHASAASLRTSLQSLVDARNEFTHGGNPRVSIGDVRRYFDDARIVIEELDQIVG